NETVLIVEDNDTVRELLCKTLARHGYTVLEAASGDEALALAHRHERPVDLLITDVVMPRMSGRQLADQLKSWQPGLRVLFVSGYTVHILEQPESPEEEPAFLQKPFTPDVLLRKMREVLAAA